jgi:membrane protein DedA with SNARE-associated domain
MTGLIESYGALGVFLLMVPESAGVPLPSEVTLLFSGFAVHQGWMSFPAAVLAATASTHEGSGGVPVGRGPLFSFKSDEARSITAASRR